MSFEKYFLTESLKERFRDRILKSRAAGTDGTSPKQFEDSLDSEIELIQRKITNMSYRFSRFNEKLILKNKFSPPRAVYIPTVRDRLVLSAVNSYLSEVFQEDLKPYQLTVKANVAEIINTIKDGQFDAFIKLDVKNFFPSLDHEILLKKLQARVEDKTAFSVLKKVLNRSECGIAQGLSISSLLAAIYLNEVDKSFKHRNSFKYFRFVDDILILCKHSDVTAIHSEIQQKTNDLKLVLHSTKVPGKSEHGCLGKNTLEYLGFSFLGDQISVRESSVEKLRKRIRQVFTDTYKNPNNLSKDINSKLCHTLNLKITGCLYNNKPYGWLFFFQDINDLTLLNHLDWYVKKCFDDFDIDYDPNKTKSFVKTYFAMKSLKPHKLDADSYVPSFDSNSTEKLTLADVLGDLPSTKTKKTNITEYYDIKELEVLM
ncbi:RNA-directed DNA polymerase [Oleispira antarctica RB-8]|uniref:RNA-directed DNA polymerase n=1 Tax=Oleispira antarctica RB-8 TaxID=698738 RepID=R4YT38_OLEAN|nr:RNA-directed DNA polymerase [Oleispira antarctica RB-8]